MGHVMRVSIQVFLGVTAAGLAYWMGGEPWASIATLILYVISYDPRPRVRATSMLAAPMVLGLGMDIGSLYSWQAVVWVFVSLGAAAPFFIGFGEAVPWRRVPWLLVSVVSLVTVVVAFRWGPTWLGSDIATRAQVLLLAAATLLVWSGLPYLPTSREARARVRGAVAGPGSRAETPVSE